MIVLVIQKKIKKETDIGTKTIGKKTGTIKKEIIEIENKIQEQDTEAEAELFLEKIEETTEKKEKILVHILKRENIFVEKNQKEKRTEKKCWSRKQSMKLVTII